MVNEAIAKSVLYCEVYFILFYYFSVLLLVGFVKCLINVVYWMKDILVIISLRYIVIIYSY